MTTCATGNDELAMTAADLAERLLGVGAARLNLDHLIEELRPDTRTGWEGPLLEFKATYRPSSRFIDRDASQPDKFIWNVLHALVAFANANGGCVILGIGESGPKLLPGDWDPDNILKRPGKEDKDLKDHLLKVLFSPVVNGKRTLKFAEGNRTYEYSLDEDRCRRLKDLVGLHPCHSQKLNCNAFVAIVRPVPKGDLLIGVKRNKNGTCESVYFHRDNTVARTNEITDIQRLNDYLEQREPVSTVYGNILSRPFKRMPVSETYFSTVPAPDPNFIGRERELDLLDGYCGEGKIPLIHAGGGTGKTQLAFKYAALHAKDYPGGCFYIPAEHAAGWESALKELLVTRANALGISTREWLGLRTPDDAAGNSTPKDRKSSGSTPENLISTVDIINSLFRKAHEKGKVLIVLDNVENPSAFFANGKLGKVFPPEFTKDISIVATSRTTKGINFRSASQTEPCTLEDLSPDTALTLLNGEAPFTSQEEHDAATGIVGILGCRALYISRISRLAEESSHRSYRRIYRKLLDDKLLVVQPREDEDDLRAPTVLWDWTRNHLAKGSEGEKDILLAEAIALFPADGIQDRILEALWYSEFDQREKNDILSLYREDSDLFYDALKRLIEYSLVQYNDEEHVIRMHRLDRAAIRAKLNRHNRQFTTRIARALASSPCMTPKDWTYLASDPDSALTEFCPYSNLDGENLSLVLKHRPESANGTIPWEKLNFIHWWQLLAHRPEFLPNACDHHIPLSPLLVQCGQTFIDHFNTDDFCGSIWARLLISFPDPASSCPLEKLNKNDWLLLLSKHPAFIERCPHRDILNTPGHRHSSRLDGVNSCWDKSEWGRCLAAQPQLAQVCDWSKLTREDTKSILLHAPQFGDRIPARQLESLDGDDWTAVVVKHPALARLYPDTTFPRKYLPGSHVAHEIDEAYGFTDDNGLDWAEAFKAHPVVLDHCPFDRLPVLQWCKLLLENPALASRNPPWDQIGRLVQRKTRTIFFQQLSPLAKLLELDQLAAYRNDVYDEYRADVLSKPDHLSDADIARHQHKIEPHLKDLIKGNDYVSLIHHHSPERPYCSGAISYLLDMPEGLDFTYSDIVSSMDPDGALDEFEIDGDELADAEIRMTNESVHAAVVKSIDQGRLEGKLSNGCTPAFAAVLICIYPELAGLFDWDMFSGRELCLIMLNRPSLKGYCDWSKLDGHDWAVLLARNPEFADICDWTKFTDSDRDYLQAERPWMIKSKTAPA